MDSERMVDQEESRSPENSESAEREAVRDEIVQLVDELGKICPGCDTIMTLEAIEAYCQNCLARNEVETKPKLFEVTQPESRRYAPNETYSFLIHVPIGDVGQRFDEIGSERDGILMTSLVSGERQGTFCGEGGFILSAPPAEAIVGMSSVDCGGEIADGRMDSVEQLQQPAPNSEYNQIDMKFGAGRVSGIMIKVDKDGKELGSPQINKDLKKIADQHNLPISYVEVAPSPVPTEISIKTTEFSTDKLLKTIDIPNTDGNFIKVDIAHGAFFHASDTVISRSMIIDRFGQVSQSLTPNQQQNIREKLYELKTKNSISEQEFNAALKGLS